MLGMWAVWQKTCFKLMLSQLHLTCSLNLCFIVQEALIYTFEMLGSGPPGVKKIIPVMSVFLSGFVFCHWLHAQAP